MERLDIGNGRSIVFPAINIDCAGLAQRDSNNAGCRICTKEHCVFLEFHFLTTFCHSERSRGISCCFSNGIRLRDASIHSTCAQGRLSVSMTNMNVRFCAILSLSIVVPALAFAQQTPQSLADAELPSLLAIYKDVHSHPELSGHEERTSALIAKELRAAGCQVTENFGKY